MIEPLRNNNDNNDNNNNNILRDILPLCRDIVSDRIDGKIISNSMASSRLALPCPSPRMNESLSTRPPPIEQDEKDEKFHFDVPLKPAWFNIGPLFRRFRRSIKPARYSRKRLHLILDLKGKKNLHRRQIRFSYSLCPYFKDTLYVFLCTSENVEGGLFAGAIRVVEEREGLLIAVTPMIGRDSGMVTGAEVSFFTASIAFAIYANAGRLTIVPRSRSLSDSFFSPSRRNGREGGEKKKGGTKKMKLVHPRSSPRRSKTNDPDPGAWMHYRRASGQKSRARAASGRHFRRIVDRVRDDDGDLGEVLLRLEPRSRTTNNKLVRWAEIDFPHSGIDEDRRCGFI